MLDELEKALKKPRVKKATNKQQQTKTFRLGTVSITVSPKRLATVELYQRSPNGSYEITQQWGEASLVLLSGLSKRAANFILNEKEKSKSG